MADKSTIETVAQLMNDLRYVGGGTYTLYVNNGYLGLTNKKDLPRYCTVIDRFTAMDINDGLTSNRWNELQSKVLSLIHKGKLK